MTLSLYLPFEIKIVLYDAIVNDRDCRVAVGMWMRVLLRGSTVRRPTSMSHSGRPYHIVEIVFCVNFFQPAPILLHKESLSFYRYLSDRVIAAILEPLKGGMDHGSSLFAIMENASEYAA